MKTYAAILVEKQGAVGWISLNRPECFNALDIQMAKELCQSSHDFSLDANIRVVVISGHGRAFCAGGDIKEMRSHLGSDVYLRDLTLYLHSFISEIVRMPKPVIAAVNGPAAGAGFSLTLACDLTIASESASFTMAYSRIGLVPDGSSTYFLPRIVGYKRAIELTLLNKPLTPREAMDMGLVNKIFPEETFIKDVNALAMELSIGPYEAFANTKKLFQTGMSESLETQMEYERREIAQQSLGCDFAEGIAAFIEKRKPNFR